MSNRHPILFAGELPLDVQLDILRVALDRFIKGLGHDPIKYDPVLLKETVIFMNDDIKEHCEDISKLSAFKKVAYFATWFNFQKPIKGKLSDGEILKSDLIKVQQRSSDSALENALFSFQFARQALVKAEIRRTSGETILLHNPISVSRHSYVDIIEALIGTSPNQHFRLVAVLFEQLAYRTNPDASYSIEH